MATKNPAQTAIAKGVIQTVWTITGTDDGRPECAPQFPVKTVSAIGTFNAQAVNIQGSSDGTNWFSLTDPGGTAISFSANGVEKITENPLYVRPLGTGVTSVVVTLISQEDA